MFFVRAVGRLDGDEAVALVETKRSDIALERPQVETVGLLLLRDVDQQ
jgi:hypothetical protein